MQSVLLLRGRRYRRDASGGRPCAAKGDKDKESWRTAFEQRAARSRQAAERQAAKGRQAAEHKEANRFRCRHHGGRWRDPRRRSCGKT